MFKDYGNYSNEGNFDAFILLNGSRDTSRGNNNEKN